MVKYEVTKQKIGETFWYIFKVYIINGNKIILIKDGFSGEKEYSNRCEDFLDFATKLSEVTGYELITTTITNTEV